METILCLTDYKANSDQTLLFALHLARHLQAQLVCAHFFEAPAATPMEEEDENTPSRAGKLRSPAPNERHSTELQRLKTFVKTSGSDTLAAIDVRYLVAGGSPLEHIPSLSREYDLALMVMGMRNRARLADRLFGTLARKMIDKTPCPLLLVPPEASFRAVHRIVYATDFGYKNLNAIERLLRWSEALDSQLYLVHVSEDPEDNPWAASQMEKIKHTYQTDNEAERMQFSVLEGELQTALEHFVETVQSDVIALTTHTRGYWEKWMASSLAKDLAEEVEIPLLVFRE